MALIDPLVILMVLFFCNLLHHPIFASDPDPVQDFCIQSGTAGLPVANHHQITRCNNPLNVTVEDFIYNGIKSPGNFSKETGLSAKPVNVNIFPGLNTLGMSFVRADFEVGGINVPHYHPRATEIAYVMEGKVYSGFIDTENRIFAKVIEKGEVMVFPRGLLHFQMNVGDKVATILGMFNSENPGLTKLPAAIFGSGINEELLEKAFGLNKKEMNKLKKKFAPQEQ